MTGECTHTYNGECVISHYTMSSYRGLDSGNICSCLSRYQCCDNFCQTEMNAFRIFKNTLSFFVIDVPSFHMCQIFRKCKRADVNGYK